MAMAAAAQVYGDEKIAWTGPVLKSCNVTATGQLEIFFNEELLRDDAVHVFAPIANTPWGAWDLHPRFASTACAELPNTTANLMCSSFGGVTPVRYFYNRLPLSRVR